jgi:hypothetical protein
MAKHQTDKPVSRSYVTPMTRAGVGDPTLLSGEDSLAHYSRRSGPGTRSKNPKRYDRDAEVYEIQNAIKRENRAKSLKFLASKKSAKK